MKRASLDALDREALIRLAEEHGITRPRILTRPELVDEILLRSATEAGGDASLARGFFGLARDLVARVVERGLHLPEAASRIRNLAADPPRRAPRVAPLPTVTLAQIYASQGHTARAVETLRRVLDDEPEHAEAGRLLATLEDTTYAPPKEPLPPEPDELPPTPEAEAEAGDERAPDPEGAEPTAASAEPATTDEPATAHAVAAPEEALPEATPAVVEAGAAPEPVATPSEPAREPVPAMLNDAPLPPRYDVTECVAISVDPETLFVYWEVREELLARVRAGRGPGVIVLRALVIEPGWEGPRTVVRDHDVHATLGDFFLRELPSGTVVRVAIGYRPDGGAFSPLAHSPLLALPRRDPVTDLAQTFVRWTPGGAVEEPNERLAQIAALAAARAREETARVECGAPRDAAPPGEPPRRVSPPLGSS